MIIRHIPMKSLKLSSFANLVKYITDTQNKQERVGKVSISNCNSVELAWAVQEVLATQAKNQRAKGDKNYHVLISFAPGENPSDEVLSIIEDRVVSSIGLGEHQRVSAVHYDTDNTHIHVAINKIHPKTYNMIEPYRAYRQFAEVASRLEVEFGLQLTNHTAQKTKSENLANDMEQHSGIESFINWMKHHCKSGIESATSWSETHNILARNGVTLRVKANGFVFCDEKGLCIKASSVSRAFSKKNLEDKFGTFVPAPNEKARKENVYRYEPLNKKAVGSALYLQYLKEKENNRTLISEKLKVLRLSKSRMIEKAKKRGRMKRMAIKLMKASRTNKKLLYNHVSKSLLADIEKIQKNYSKERQRIIESYKIRVWADWLKNKAEQGNTDALQALRYRNRKNRQQYTISGDAINTASQDKQQIDSITKEGTAIHKHGKATIRNTGNEIKISKGNSIEGLKEAIEMAIKQYGPCIQVNGTELFKKAVIKTAIHYQIQVTFNCPDMEKERIHLLTQKENTNESTRASRSLNGTGASRGDETAGRSPSRGKGKGVISRIRDSLSNRRQPNTDSLRQGPPAQSDDGLRNLSQLSVVQLSRGSEVLLPGHAHDKLERKRGKPDNDVRRKIFGMKKNNK